LAAQFLLDSNEKTFGYQTDGFVEREISVGKAENTLQKEKCQKQF